MDVQDYLTSIGFRAPSSFVEMRAWFEIYKSGFQKKTFEEILYSVGVSYKKSSSLKQKFIKGFTQKELIKVIEYSKTYMTEITSVIYYINTL
jgi:hypothetical protein